MKKINTAIFFPHFEVQRQRERQTGRKTETGIQREEEFQRDRDQTKALMQMKQMEKNNSNNENILGRKRNAEYKQGRKKTPLGKLYR